MGLVPDIVDKFKSKRALNCARSTDWPGVAREGLGYLTA
jgi:hypothetical protein